MRLWPRRIFWCLQNNVLFLLNLGLRTTVKRNLKAEGNVVDKFYVIISYIFSEGFNTQNF